MDAGTFLKADFFCHRPNGATQTDYAQPDIRCDLAHGTGDDPCDGPLDRFGRVTDLLWYDYGSSADLLRFKHGYDRAGNRLYREEADTSDLDQLYSYDDVNRLVQSEEGTLSAGKDSISSLNFKQEWSLDPTGNWSAFKEDDDGDAAWDLEQTRTSSAVNEITDVAETAGPSWITPAYNRTGNMTTIPQPADPTQSYATTYDAWNRLVKLQEGQDTVAQYVFDGAKRLVVRKKYASGSLSQTRHFYHTAGWQTIEERLESGGQIGASADRQFTWGLRYIDDLVCRTVSSTHDYAFQDANWNVILSSTALARVVYEPYGQICSTSPAASGDLDAWQHYFAGYQRDEDTGLYLVRHRVYQAELGCWVQRDPVGFGAHEVNFYNYTHSSPQNAVDAHGTRRTSVPILDCQGYDVEEAGSWLCAMLNHLIDCNPRQLADAKAFCDSKGFDLCGCTQGARGPSSGPFFSCMKRKKDKGQCACGYVRTDHKGNEYTQWDPAGKGSITYEEYRSYCKAHFGNRLTKIKWNGKYYNP